MSMATQEEAVRENLKNVVLFMASSGYLVSPKQEASKEKLWMETWKRIDRFLPDLRSDLALEEPDEFKKGEDKQEAEERGEVEVRTEESEASKDDIKEEKEEQGAEK